MFALDSRLQQDCLLVGDFPLCRLLLMNDSNYPWFILVPRREANDTGENPRPAGNPAADANPERT